MQAPKKSDGEQSKLLTSPDFVNEAGDLLSVAQAQQNSWVVVSESLNSCAVELGIVSRSLEIISTYFYRKGLEDNVFHPDDLEYLAEKIEDCKDDSEPE